MSFLSKLTDLYYYIKNSNQSLDFLYSSGFKDYLYSSAKDFVEIVYVCGFEVRDEEHNTIDKPLKYFIDLALEGRKKFNEEIENNRQFLMKYNIGLINCYLHFCQREPLELTPSIRFNSIENNPIEVESKPNVLIDIDSSVDYLRQACMLADETISLAKGVYLYEAYRTWDYIFSIFQNYKVDNDNIPPDLDSFYVFQDSFYDKDIWEELKKQMKVKYGT